MGQSFRLYHDLLVSMLKLVRLYGRAGARPLLPTDDGLAASELHVDVLKVSAERQQNPAGSRKTHPCDASTVWGIGLVLFERGLLANEVGSHGDMRSAHCYAIRDFLQRCDMPLE